MIKITKEDANAMLGIDRVDESRKLSTSGDKGSDTKDIKMSGERTVHRVTRGKKKVPGEKSKAEVKAAKSWLNVRLQKHKLQKEKDAHTLANMPASESEDRHAVRKTPHGQAKTYKEVKKGPAKLGKSEKYPRQAFEKRARSRDRLSDREESAARLSDMGPDARRVKVSKQELRSPENDVIAHIKARGVKKVRGQKPKPKPKPKLDHIEPTGQSLVFESDWIEAEGGERRSEQSKSAKKVGRIIAKNKMKKNPNASVRRRNKAVKSGEARATKRFQKVGRGIRKARGSKALSDERPESDWGSDQKERTLDQSERTKKKAESGRKLP